MSKYILSLGLTLALASLQAQTTNNGSQHSNQAAQNEQTQNQQSQMKNQKARASDSAYRVLNEAYRAQQALGKSDRQTAKQDVNQALNAVDTLNGNSSQNGIVPLYTELGEYTLIGARQHKGQTNSSAANNNTSKDKVAVRKVEGDFTAVTFNVKMARNHLEAAKQALDKGDTKTANDALSAVQDAVVEESVATDLPLVKARENLMLSRTAAIQGDYKEAHAALQSASNSLATYAQENGSHANDAKQLRSEIDNYNASIQQNHSDATNKIEGWWNEVTDWNANNNGTSNQSKMNRKNLGNSASNKTSNK